MIATYKPEHIQRLLAFRPSQAKYRRAQLMALVVIDTGMRIKELLSPSPPAPRRKPETQPAAESASTRDKRERNQ